MSVTAIGSSVALNTQALADLRARIEDLQRQLGTGKRSVTYAGVGLDRGLAAGLRTRLAALESFQDTITTVGVRLDLAQSSLGRMDEITRAFRSATQLSGYEIDNTGQTTGQKTARFQLEELLDLLNTQAGDRYLFSGRAGDRPAVDTIGHILDGDGARAGFKQIMSERRQADLGASGLGRLVIGSAGSVASIDEDVAGSPFGFKLASVTSGLTNAVVAGPAGAPPGITVDFTGGNPNAGETITLSFTLPDGSTEAVTLAATASATPGPNEFTIGGTTAATAANLDAALTSAVGKLARTALAAASATAAANDFFDMDDANPPRRVDGPPFDSATALIAGTPADTVTWYVGEAGSDPARSTALARVDQSITAPYGMRANEQALRLSVQNVAVFASMAFSATDPDAQERYDALKDRISAALSDLPGQQEINDILAEIATAQATLGAARDRHRQTNGVLSNLLDHIEGVSMEEVGAQLLALNTRLQASLQTTALLHQSSLVNYL